jgi:hypothetical protein
MTEFDLHPAGVSLVDQAKDESTSTDSSVSSHRSEPGETLTGRQAADEDELIRYDYPPPTNIDETPQRPQEQLEPRSSSPATPLYNPYTQHNYSPARSQRRLSGIGISLSLEDLRNALNQEFPLLMPHEEKKQERSEESDGDSDLDPDERLALMAHRIRSEIRQSEMLELAVEAERAAEAGLESFMGRASTFGDDMAVIESKKLKHPAALKRNSTYSEGYLRQRPYPRLRPQPKKIRVLALRAVDEVIPPLGEIHSHLRTHLARSNVDEETLVFQESDFAEDSERGSSSAFFMSFHNWVSKSSNLSTPPRCTSERDTLSTRLSTKPNLSVINSSPDSLASQDDEEQEEDSYSTDSSVVGETLAEHIISQTGSPQYRPMSPEVKVPPGLEWSTLVASRRTELVSDSVSIFDAVPPPPLLHEAKTKNCTVSPSFEECGSVITDDAAVSFHLHTPDPMIPIALFDAMEDGESDSAHNPNSVPLSANNEMITPDIVGRKTPDADFVTPVRLRDIRDKGSESSFGVATRTENCLNVFTSIGRPLQPRKSEIALLPRKLSSPAYAATTFIAKQSESCLDGDLRSAPDCTVDIKLIYQPFIEIDNEPLADTSIDQPETSVDEERSAVESVTIETLGEKQADREPLVKPQGDPDHLELHVNAKKDLTPKDQVVAVVNSVEQREDNSFQAIHNDPSSEYSLILANTPDDSLLDNAIESDVEERVQPSPTATSTSGTVTDEEGALEPSKTMDLARKSVDLTRNLIEPATPPIRAGCECLVPLSRTEELNPRSMVDELEKEETAQQIRRVASCPSLVDVIDNESHSPFSSQRGLSRSPSHRREKTVWSSLGLEEHASSASNRRTRRSDSLQVAMDNMIAKLSPATCGSPKYPYISHAENNDFLNNYLYCSKPAEQWNLLDAATSFDDTTQSASIQCVNFIFGSSCDGITNLVTSLFPKRRSFESREIFTLNKETYAEADPDSWFNVAAERFDGALERLVGRAREQRNRFQAPSLKKKPPSVRRISSPPDDLQDDSIVLVREKAPDEVVPQEQAQEHTLSDPQFRIIYGMSRERFQELNTVATRFNDRFTTDHPEEESATDPKRALLTSLSALTG